MTMIDPIQTLPNLSALKEAFELAKMVTESNFFPAWKGKPHDAAIAILFGQSLGLSWGYSLLNISVINGRPTLWGDAMLALCRKAVDFEYCHETFDEKTMTAFCAAKRKGEKEEVQSFSQKDAQQAGLWGKKDNWIKYPKRMLQMRARAFALRDVFTDVLQGLGCAEEVQDYPESLPPKTASRKETTIVSFPATVLKGVAQRDTVKSKSSLTLMRERLDAGRQYQQQKGIEAVERLKTMMPALQQRKGVCDGSTHRASGRDAAGSA